MGAEEVGVDVAGFPLKIKGREMLTVVVLSAALGYIVWDTRSQIATHHATMLQQSVQLQETMDEFVFIQSLPEDERMKLRLSMPESLRRKVRLAEDRRQ